MGNSMMTFGKGARAAAFAALAITISISVVMAFPYAKRLLTDYDIPYYEYRPPADVAYAADTSDMPPAKAVPAVMYHGVTLKEDGSNTSVANFVAHMELLKREGYETISVAEYDLWRQGKFELPPKPIIITFDDGRKDSYFTTDRVLEKLGFKATIFVATGRTEEGNSFFLTWDELRRMRDSGRWEIQAHGHHSHDEVRVADAAGSKGFFLTSRMYLPSEGRLETVEEFDRRIESDYAENVEEIKANLGIEPAYFAIPLNDYGQQAVTNHDGAVAWNGEQIRSRFKLAFILVNSGDDVLDIGSSFYNFEDEDPYRIKRIEMKNMSAADFGLVLEAWAPTEPRLAVENKEVMAAAAGESAQAIYGEGYWTDYEVRARIRRAAGRSAMVVFGYRDGKNYSACGLTDNGYFIRSTKDGTTTDLARPRTFDRVTSNDKNFRITYRDGMATCAVNGVTLFENVPVPTLRGSVGVKVWSDKVRGGAAIRSLEVKPL